MRPVSVIVDITNYVMLETGQPLHAFDADRVTGGLTARQARDGETLETLDHVERVLTSEDLVIADETGPLALAGTMGGVTSEIDTNSSNILLEAAHFDPVVVAKMSRRHKLSSEASRRFERGVDRTIAPYASELAAALILTYAGGSYAGLTAEEAPGAPTRISLSAQFLEAKVAGMEIPRSNRRMPGVRWMSGGTRRRPTGCHPATWRPDLTDPADLVEEVIRLIGYDHIPSTLPSACGGARSHVSSSCVGGQVAMRLHSAHRGAQLPVHRIDGSRQVRNPS